jgi:phage terminase large subunit
MAGRGIFADGWGRGSPVTIAFDFRNPDYIAVYEQRLKRLETLRKNPALLPGVMGWYRDHPWDLINDWGMTYDPRNVERGLPAVVPFLLFPRQREWCEWVVERWKAGGPGVSPKSRDVGMSWLSVGLAAALCLTHENLAAGFGSRKWEYVDKLSSPKSLFWKAREFLKRLPPEINGGWNHKRDSVEGRISFPGSGSVMTGEAGDGIGRGDRASIYFVDESAHLERPALIDASLSATTNCRIDISSANGIGNSFYQKFSDWSGKAPERVFTLHWRDDPRKDDEWYRKQCDELDPVTVAQEIDINFAASQTGILIPAAWISAAIDADKVLGFTVRGDRRGALDVADEGKDMNAFAHRYGIALEFVEPWSGKGDDIFGTVQKAFQICDESGITEWDYDADGLGAGVRGDARVINTERAKAGNREQIVRPWRGSGEVWRPDSPIPSVVPGPRGKFDRKNADFFLNAKAQGWWELRVRFQRTHRAVTSFYEAQKSGEPWTLAYEPDDLIVIRKGLPQLARFTMELSQPTYTQTTAGKIQVNKTPEDTKSPNMADAVMMLYAPRKVSFLSKI